jgi:myo-inositol-1(or 4)-monophosphatase
MNAADLEAALFVAQAAAAAGAAVLRGLWRGAQTTLAEKGRDIKLQADRDAEAAILAVLDATPWPRLAEESGEHGAVAQGDTPYWVVDPLDGTVNFSRGIPFCSVSLALCVGDRPLLGVVTDFVHDETFSGAPGHGARLNGRPMRVSELCDAGKALVGFGMPLNRDYGESETLEFHRTMNRFRRGRQLGSAALLLAWVACGRLDAYFIDDIMFWDIAAGMALVEAAGGWVEAQPSPTMPWARKIRVASHKSIWNL